MYSCPPEALYFGMSFLQSLGRISLALRFQTAEIPPHLLDRHVLVAMIESAHTKTRWLHFFGPQRAGVALLTLRPLLLIYADGS